MSGVYWLSGVNDDFGVFLCVLCLLVLCVLMFQSLGMLISVLCPKRAPTVALLFLYPEPSPSPSPSPSP